MSNWISSKLRVAETFLNQIDQQAAESLKKGENDRFDDDESKSHKPIKSSSIVSLKDQLKKKPQENTYYLGNLNSDPNFGRHNNNNNYVNNRSSVSATSEPSKASLTDSDWTELLSTPTSGSRNGNANANLVKGLKKDGKRVQKGSHITAVKPARRSSDVGKINGKLSEEEESGDSSGRSSNELQNNGKLSGNPELDKNEESDGQFNEKKLSEDFSQLTNSNQSSEIVTGKVDGSTSDMKVRERNIRDKLRANNLKGKDGSNAALAGSISDGLKKGSSTSDGSSVSDSESGSSSDSEREWEKEERRRRRAQILAEKTAAKAAEAIKERENLVAKLEGEKQSLEKILEERAKQHVQEASTLQTTMLQTMEAAEQEKQKHNHTRMEALGILAKLETTTGNLARSLTSKQKNLDVEIDRVAELQRQIELKEVAHGELRRRISNTPQLGSRLNKSAAAKGVEFEMEILEEEYSFITDKIEQMQDKANKLELDIEMIRKEKEDPTEVEIELKRRRGQLTDRLIQKQTQVESLSSEKATILFRIEVVSTMLEENKSSVSDLSSTSSKDLESGTFDITDSKFRPMIENKIRSGRKHLESLIQQLDAIFLAGVVFFKRNSTAKLLAVFYLVCLHLWVIYILMSHSQPEDRSGAVISLENINRTDV